MAKIRNPFTHFWFVYKLFILQIFEKIMYQSLSKKYTICKNTRFRLLPIILLYFIKTARTSPIYRQYRLSERIEVFQVTD
mgnify:CR=1 FL=1